MPVREWGKHKPVSENNFNKGNPQDGRHYWLSPAWLLRWIKSIIGNYFDPCPFPKPDEFDGLKSKWTGDSIYINPPFGSVIYPGTKKKVGMTAWVRRAIKEMKKGKDIVMVYPQHRWIHMLIEADAEFFSLGNVNWESTEEPRTAKPASSPIMAFILRGKKRAVFAYKRASEKQQMRNQLRIR
jgi:hypothetical protein